MTEDDELKFRLAVDILESGISKPLEALEDKDVVNSIHHESGEITWDGSFKSHNEVVCVDNIGMEDSFILGVSYLYEEHDNKEMLFVTDRLGKRRECYKERFEDIIKRKPWLNKEQFEDIIKRKPWLSKEQLVRVGTPTLETIMQSVQQVHSSNDTIENKIILMNPQDFDSLRMEDESGLISYSPKTLGKSHIVGNIYGMAIHISQFQIEGEVTLVNDDRIVERIQENILHTYPL